jgi:sugar O-acyltransferase (sialic acid O-acetyltransferase NeuD family)
MENMVYQTPHSVVLFGTTPWASLIRYYLEHDTPCRVVSFTVDRSFLHSGSHDGLPVVPFEEIENVYPPASTHIMVAVGYAKINRLRMERFLEAKSKGYRLLSYVSPKAQTWPDFRVRENTMINEQAVIQPFSSIGENTIIRSNAYISHHSQIGDHAFIAAGAVLGGNVIVGNQAFIGLGAVIRDGITIAPRTFVGAGAVVIKDTEADGVYVGNPAKKILHKTSTDVTGNRS